MHNKSLFVRDDGYFRTEQEAKDFRDHMDDFIPLKPGWVWGTQKTPKGWTVRMVEKREA